MARKVFISVLGTGNYQPCTYTGTGEFEPVTTRFIQEAVVKYIKVTKWENNDKLLFFLTDKAKERNWDGDEGLEKILTDSKTFNGSELKCGIETIKIPEGKDENELWEVFSIIFNQLEDGDELYIDLTHGFRYLPMLVLVLGNYAKFLKDIKIKHLSYGNFEAKVDGNAPIMDLLPFSMLQDWTFAAADLIQNGNISKLTELSKAQALAPLFRGERRLIREAITQPLQTYIGRLGILIDNMKRCKGCDILTGAEIETIKGLKDNVNCNLTRIIAPLPPIVNKIHATISAFSQNSDDSPIIQNGYEAAKWCHEHQLYQQAVTITFETIITHVCCACDVDWKTYDFREAVKNLIVRWPNVEQDFALDEVRKNLLSNTKFYNNLDNLIGFVKDKFIDLRAIRNVYNHANMIDGSRIEIDDTTIMELKTTIDFLIGISNDTSIILYL